MGMTGRFDVGSLGLDGAEVVLSTWCVADGMSDQMFDRALLGCDATWRATRAKRFVVALLGSGTPGDAGWRESTSSGSTTYKTWKSAGCQKDC